MRQLAVVVVAVLACVAYAMQAKAGSPLGLTFDEPASSAQPAVPEPGKTKDTESAP